MTDIDRKINVIFVCFANVCRSTMAEFIFKNIVKRAGKEDEFEISSAGVFERSVGMNVHDGTREVLERYGVPYNSRTARMITPADYAKADYIVCMDRANVEGICEICGGDPDQKIQLLMSFTGDATDVPDPWYTDDFDETYDAIIEGCRALYSFLVSQK